MSNFISDIKKESILVGLNANCLTSMILPPPLQKIEQCSIKYNRINPICKSSAKCVFVPCDFVLPKQI